MKGFTVIQELRKGGKSRQLATRYLVSDPHRVMQMYYGPADKVEVVAEYLGDQGWTQYATFEAHEGSCGWQQLPTLAYRRGHEQCSLPRDPIIPSPDSASMLLLEQARIGEPADSGPACSVCGKPVGVQAWGNAWGKIRQAVYHRACWGQ